VSISLRDLVCANGFIDSRWRLPFFGFCSSRHAALHCRRARLSYFFMLFMLKRKLGRTRLRSFLVLPDGHARVFFLLVDFGLLLLRRVCVVCGNVLDF